MNKAPINVQDSFFNWNFPSGIVHVWAIIGGIPIGATFFSLAA